MMKKFAITMLVTCVGAFAWAADDANSNANTELQRATETVQNITSAPADKGVPNQVLEGAKCVAVIPKLALSVMELLKPLLLSMMMLRKF